MGTKRPGREVNHSPTSSAEVKNGWIYVSTPPVRLHGVERGKVPLKNKSSWMLPAIYVKQPVRGDSKTVKTKCYVTLYFIVLNAEMF
jgi:hypothetical protein